jgi:tetratricopeptide (TPR) repeat protein
VENWKEGVQAALDRPLTGYGPGRWRAATSSRRTLDVARQGPDRLYADAHNLPIEYLATTGFVGAGLLVAWLTAVALGLRRSVRPELAAAALALLVAHALEPMHMTITPLMLLLAGAAGARPDPDAPPGVVGLRAGQAVLVAAALLFSARTIVGDVTFRSGDLDFDLARMQRATSLLRPWPNPVTQESRIHAFRARTQKDRRELVAALASAREARRLEPENPLRSIAVAAFLGQLGRHDDAAREYGRALEHNPWSRQALGGRAEELRALDRVDQASRCTYATQLARHDDADHERARRD